MLRLITLRYTICKRNDRQATCVQAETPLYICLRTMQEDVGIIACINTYL